MIRELLKRLQAVLRAASAKNGNVRVLDPMMALRLSYYNLCRLAAQIDDHAGKAPYPQIAQRLEQIALEKRRSVEILREKILSLQGHLDEPQPNPKSGKNHWQRMVQDLQDQKALETLLAEQSVRLAEDAPEISDLLKEIVAAQIPHSDILMDLVARADPQANQS